MSRSRVASAFVLVAVLVAIPYGARPAVISHLPSAEAPVTEWPTADGVEGTHYSPLADISVGNIHALEVAWTYRTGDVSDGTAGEAVTAFEATPIMVDGALYLSTPFSRVVALDAETGSELWTFDPDIN